MDPHSTSSPATQNLGTPSEVSVLARIRAYQDGISGMPTYDIAHAEIKEGRKRSHWIWYIWPTLVGVRSTQHPELELRSVQEARAYLNDIVLANRLLEITSAATAQLVAGVDPAVLFGAMHMYDAPKFQEACTLFLIAAEQERLADVASIFQAGLDAISGGRRNARVICCIEKAAAATASQAS